MRKINFYLLGINLFFLQSYLVRFEIGAYPTNLQEILIGLNILTFIGQTIEEKKIWTVTKGLLKHWIILVLIGLSIFSLLTVDLVNTTYAARHGKFLFFGSVLTIIFIETVKKKKEYKKLLNIGINGAIFFGIASLIYNLLGHNITHDLRLNGPLDSAVSMAFYLSPFFILSIIQSLRSKKKSHLFQTMTLLVLIILTRSMGAYLGILLVTIIYTITNKNLKLLQKKSIKIGLTIISIIIFGLVFYSKILPTFQTKYSSLDERQQIWKTTTTLLKEPKNFIFGLGFGQFEEQYRNNVIRVLGGEPLDYNNPHPHNIFLLFMSQYGILGLLFITYIFFLLIKNLKKPTPLLFVLLYFFIHGLIDSPFFKNDIMILFLISTELSLIPQLRQPR